MFRPHSSTQAVPTGGGGDSYVWVGPSGGAWDTPADWQDTTTGTTGISAPGSADSATISGPVPYGSPLLVTGGGEAASLTTIGSVSLEGSYELGSLLVAGSLDLASSQAGSNEVVATDTLVVRRDGELTLQQSDVAVGGASTVFGEISMTAASRLQTGDVTLRASSPDFAGPGLSVDATSTLEIGHAGAETAGALTIDKGHSLSGSGYVYAGVVDNGALVVAGSLQIIPSLTNPGAGTLGGSGRVQIDARSELAVDAVSAGLTIDFAGIGGVLDLSGATGTDQIAAGATLVGFVAGDAIRFAVDITATHVIAIPGGESVQLLDGSGQIVDTLTLRGATAATTYLLVHALGGSLLVAAPASVAGPPPPGTSGRDRYVWTGALGTEWGTAGNWLDATTGGVATVAPGQHDDVRIRPGANGLTIVTGVGQADTLSILSRGYFTPPVLMDGQFSFNTIIGAGILLEIGATSLIVADRVRGGNGSTLSGAYVIEGGTLRMGSGRGGSWSLLEGATVQADTVDSVSVSLDATSRFEVGTAGGAAAGVLTIDSGARVGGRVTVQGTVVDDGTLRVNGGLDRISGALEGSGTAVLTAGATLLVSGGLAGVDVDFADGGSTLELGAANSDQTFSMTGFRPSDVLLVNDVNANDNNLRAAYRATGANLGTLTITDVLSGDTLATIAMIGAYTGEQFLLTDNGFFQEDMIVLPAAVRHADPSAGTTSPQNYVWNGGTVQGGWGNAANWQDSTTGTAATIAPGRLDNVTINGGTPSVTDPYIIYPPPLVIVGSGDAGTLTTTYQVVFDGLFDVGTFQGTLRVAGQGSVFAAGTLSSPYDLDVDGGRVVAGEVTAGLVTVEDGGSASFQSLTFSNLAAFYQNAISLDATSSLVVGPMNTVAAPGTITVADGATLSGYNGIESPLLDDGIVEAQQMTVEKPVSGFGQLVEQSGGLGNMVIDGSVASGITVALAATSGELFIIDPADMHAKISGFSDGDLIELTGLLSATSLAYSYAGNDFGQLTLRDAHGTTLDTLDLAGDYRTATFTLTADTGYGQSITVAGHTA